MRLSSSHVWWGDYLFGICAWEIVHTSLGYVTNNAVCSEKNDVALFLAPGCHCQTWGRVPDWMLIEKQVLAWILWRILHPHTLWTKIVLLHPLIPPDTPFPYFQPHFSLPNPQATRPSKRATSLSSATMPRRRPARTRRIWSARCWK